MTHIIAVAIGFVIGILVGRRNRNTVESSVAGARKVVDQAEAAVRR